MNEQNWITVTINVNLIYSELKELSEVNDGKNRGGNVQKLQLGKNQTQCPTT